jgi:hypothetical protein
MISFYVEFDSKKQEDLARIDWNRQRLFRGNEM